MDIRALITECQLDAALAAAESAVRANPLDFRSRTTLFSLLAFAGQDQRAEQQLTVLGQESEEAAKGVSTYRALLAAQQMRDRVLRAQESPQYLLQTPGYAPLQAQVLHCVARQDLLGAKQALDELAQQRPPCAVQIGQSVGQIRDADDRLSSVVELFLQDRYVWLPWEQLRGLHVPRPTQLRDLLWTPVVVDLDIGQLQGFMPVLYPETTSSDDPRVRLGRMTVWQDNDLGLSLGRGARLLSLHMPAVAPAQTEDGDETGELLDIPLLEVGSLQRWDAVAADPSAADQVAALSGAA